MVFEYKKTEKTIGTGEPLVSLIWRTILVNGKIRETNKKSWLTLKLTLLSFFKMNSKLICLKDPEVSTSGC